MGEQGEAETRQDGVVADPGAELQDSGDKAMLDGVVLSLKVQVHSLGVLPGSGMDSHITSVAREPFISLFEKQIGPLSGDGNLILVIQMLVTSKAIAAYVVLKGSPWTVRKLELLKMWLQRCCHIITVLKQLHCFPIAL